jgi:hypothetical protein
MSQRYDLVRRIKSDLEEAGPGKVMPIDDRILLDILPHYWTQDAPTMEEWFIKFCRAFGLHATHDPISHQFRVRITLDAEDEATITWPGAAVSRS